MATTMKIEIVGRETIKPSSPTPENLRNFKLSILDQTAPALYTPLLLFYSANDDTHGHVMQAAQRSQHLKTSLSKMLTQFYPLAGVFKDHTIIECNDEGVEYVDARVNCLLSDILHQTEASLLLNFLPVEVDSMQAESGPLLFVQANFFECGGLAIGVCISHKIADGSTLGTVMKSWSATSLAMSCYTVTTLPAVSASSVFPPVLDSWIPPMKLIHDNNVVTKRYVFEPSKIAALKANAASTTVPQPTRVEALTALIWKCMIHVSRSIKGFPTLSRITHAVNLRKRTEPPLPENSIGNVVGFFCSSHLTENEIDLQGLVCKIRKELTEFNKTALQTINQEKKTWYEMCGIQKLDERDDIDCLTFSSWCRFPFYDADFGWGKPTWATFPGLKIKNIFILMDARDGKGIEALVSLSKEEMILFESDEELQEFSAVDPSVVVN